MALEALGVFVLVVLILVGALLPLKYMARTHLPRLRGARDEKERAEDSRPEPRKES
jgi:hypothetical protein